MAGTPSTRVLGDAASTDVCPLAMLPAAPPWLEVWLSVVAPSSKSSTTVTNGSDDSTPLLVRPDAMDAAVPERDPRTNWDAGDAISSRKDPPIWWGVNTG